VQISWIALGWQREAKVAIITQNRPVAGFDRIDLRGYGDIVLIQGDEERLAITADEKVMPRLISEVRGGRLVLDQDHTWLDWITFGNSPIHYEIGVKLLNGVTISGTGTFVAARLESAVVQMGVTGSGKIKIDDLQTQNAEITIGGSGEVRLSGNAAKTQIRTSGSAKIYALELACQEVELRISGSGQAWVQAEKSLNVNVSGSAKVYYRGNPTLSPKISGSARIEPAK
jgi:hypothetical protein